MSIEAMIREHPHVKGGYNEALGKAVHHLKECAAICASCADACLGEEGAQELLQCVRACMDCADVCEAAMKLALRRTGANEEAIIAQLRAALTVLEICAAECEEHAARMAHCKRCAQMCNETIADCEKALATFG